MKAAFLFAAVFPPPTAGALRLAGAHRAGARRATDRQKSSLVQRVDRDLVGGGKLLQSLAGPIDQRVELEEIALSIGNHKTDLHAIRRLLGTQAGDPSLRAHERPLERLDFSHVATGDARLLRIIESVDALGRDEIFKRRLARIDRPDAAAIAPLGFFPDRIGFGEQPASVERDDIDIEPGVANVMKDDLIFQPEASGENDRSVDPIADRRKTPG